jgi:hypothetical protein
VIPYEQGFRKVGRKCRRGRRANPVGHRGHRKAYEYSRPARLLKRRFDLLFAPTVEEHDVFTRPVASGVHVGRRMLLGALALPPSYKDAPRAVVAAEGLDPRGKDPR